jgi:hypothetical protein
VHLCGRNSCPRRPRDPPPWPPHPSDSSPGVIKQNQAQSTSIECDQWHSSALKRNQAPWKSSPHLEQCLLSAHTAIQCNQVHSSALTLSRCLLRQCSYLEPGRRSISPSPPQASTFASSALTCARPVHVIAPTGAAYGVPTAGIDALLVPATAPVEWLVPAPPPLTVAADADADADADAAMARAGAGAAAIAGGGIGWMQDCMNLSRSSYGLSSAGASKTRYVTYCARDKVGCTQRQHLPIIRGPQRQYSGP